MASAKNARRIKIENKRNKDKQKTIKDILLIFMKKNGVAKIRIEITFAIIFPNRILIKKYIPAQAKTGNTQPDRDNEKYSSAVN